MAQDLGNVARRDGPLSLPARPCGMHLVLDEPSLRAFDCVCGHGRHSPPFCGAYPRARIAVMLSGTFHVRSSGGTALTSADGFLAANRSDEYEFRHVDDGGDRSLVFDYDDALLDEVAASTVRGSRAAERFRRFVVPGAPDSAWAVARAHAAARSGDVEAVREAALGAAGVALQADGDRSPSSAFSQGDARRVATTLRYIAGNRAGDCSLATLAAHARLSLYHYLRLFRAITGQTPRQYVIATRLRAAATELRETKDPITEIALGSGWNDVSHFTTTFTRTFGVSPRRFRARESRR